MIIIDDMHIDNPKYTMMLSTYLPLPRVDACLRQGGFAPLDPLLVGTLHAIYDDLPNPI